MTLSSQHRKLARQGLWEFVLALISVVLTVLAAVYPYWIEQLTFFKPDDGTGELEWLLAVTFGIASVVFGARAYFTRRRLRALRDQLAVSPR